MFFLAIFIILAGLLVGTSLLDFIEDDSLEAKAPADAVTMLEPAGGLQDKYL